MVSAMKEFEFRYFDSNGHVTAVEHFQYLSSYSAMVSAEKRGETARVEVWFEERCIYSSAPLNRGEVLEVDAGNKKSASAQ